MSDPKVRVRFAPSPTGFMHLGNIRTALMNYLFAKQRNGTFILRVEDTDPSRNHDPQAKKIISDLEWLGLTYDEGPIKGGPYAPYFQSERQDIYKEHLEKLKAKHLVYRCFCTSETLDRKKQRQIAMKQPPRYDRTCTKLTQEEIDERVANNVPFIWRIKLDHDRSITIEDVSHGPITFELKNFSDFPLTRQDGTFTFMFANFVDDLIMKISHVLRGEDHLTNSAGQAALYDAFSAPLPMFWHMPILCNLDGKKMSKRDFGFSLNDLMQAGYLPEAITNYLAITGGGSFENEIMSLPDIAQTLNFANASTSGHVKYDPEKLKWINHKWIDQVSAQELLERCLPILEHTYPAAATLDDTKLSNMLQMLKPGFTTLNDCVTELGFYFTEPVVTQEQVNMIENVESIKQLVTKHLAHINNADHFISELKKECKQNNIGIKPLFQFLRLALMGAVKGPSIHELIDMLGAQEAEKRITNLLV